MSFSQSSESENPLLSQAIALVEKATEGKGDPRVVEILLKACSFLEESSRSDAPIVAIEQELTSETGTYHLFARRLSSSVPPGKFQIVINRDLAFGLIY